LGLGEKKSGEEKQRRDKDQSSLLVRIALERDGWKRGSVTLGQMWDMSTVGVFSTVRRRGTEEGRLTS